MKTNFKFSNLLGTVYCRGNLLFSPDGTHLFSPVGNRVTVFNLVEYESHSFRELDGDGSEFALTLAAQEQVLYIPVCPSQEHFENRSYPAG